MASPQRPPRDGEGGRMVETDTGQKGTTLAPGSPAQPRPITPLADIMKASLAKKSPKPIRSKQPTGVVHRPMPMKATTTASFGIGGTASPAGLAPTQPAQPAPAAAEMTSHSPTPCSSRDVTKDSPSGASGANIPTEEIPDTAVSDKQGTVDTTDDGGQAGNRSRSGSRSPAVEELLGKVEDTDLGDLLDFLEGIDTNPGVDTVSKTKADVISKLEQAGPFTPKKSAIGSAFAPVPGPSGTPSKTTKTTESPSHGKRPSKGNSGRPQKSSTSAISAKPKPTPVERKLAPKPVVKKLSPEPAVRKSRSRSRSPAIEEMLGNVDESELGDLLEFLGTIDDLSPGESDTKSESKSKDTEHHQCETGSQCSQSEELEVPAEALGDEPDPAEMDRLVEIAEQESMGDDHSTACDSGCADAEHCDSTASCNGPDVGCEAVYSNVSASGAEADASDCTYSDTVCQASNEQVPEAMATEPCTDDTIRDPATELISENASPQVPDEPIPGADTTDPWPSDSATQPATELTSEGLSPQMPDVSNVADSSSTPYVTSGNTCQGGTEGTKKTILVESATTDQTSSEAAESATKDQTSSEAVESATKDQTSSEATVADSNASVSMTVPEQAIVSEGGAEGGAVAPVSPVAGAEAESESPDPANPAAVARGLLRRTSSIQIDARFEKNKSPPRDHVAYATDGVLLYWSSITSNRDMKWKTQHMIDAMNSKKIPFSKVDITEHRSLLQRMRDLMGTRRSVPPQIFHGERFLGGYAEFEDAVEAGTLHSFLRLQ